VIAGFVISRRRATPGRGGRARSGGFAGFWAWPFTEPGWRRTLFSLVAAPVCGAQFLLTVAGQVKIARRIEAWRLRRFLHIDVSQRSEDGNGLAAVARYLMGLPVGIVLSAATLVAFFSVFRVGMQVSSFAASGNINAWGGPTYLGALLAHWLDSMIAFYICVVTVRALSGLQALWVRAQRERPVGAGSGSPGERVVR